MLSNKTNKTKNVFPGAHLLLFFLAFVFGSFCTFCFHMLMYLFDEKCVLFPKLLSLTTLKRNVIYEFLPINKEIGDSKNELLVGISVYFVQYKVKDGRYLMIFTVPQKKNVKMVCD